MLDYVLNLPYSYTIVPCPLLSSAHTSTLHFLVLPYHTILLLTPPHLVLSYLTSSPTSPQLLLYLIFSFTSINLVSHLPPSHPFLSYLILPFILSPLMSSHFSIFLIPPHYVPFFLPYFISSHPGLSYLIHCLTLLYTISFYPTSSPTFPATSPLPCPALFCLIDLHLPYLSVSLHLLLPHPTSSLIFPHFIPSVPPHPT